jgi:dihydrofolate reductase
MRRLCFSAAVSLDGFIAGPKGEIDWIAMDPELDFEALFARFDALLVGRKSWEAAQAQGGVGMPGMTCVVVSRTLDPAHAGGMRVARDPAAAVRDLRAAPGKDIWLFGGGELLASCLEQGLVDEVQLAYLPVLLGDGVPLLPRGIAPRTALRVLRQRFLPRTGTWLVDCAVEGRERG